MKFKSELDPHPESMRKSILCDACSTPNPPSRCSVCHLTYYCHEACAKNHWQVHKAYCKSLSEFLLQNKLVLVNTKQATNTTDETVQQNDTCTMCERVVSHTNPLYHWSQQGENGSGGCCQRSFCLECINNYHASSLLIGSSSSSSADADCCPKCRVEREEGKGEKQNSTVCKSYQAAIWTATAQTKVKARDQKDHQSKAAHKALDYAEALLDEDSNNQAAKILQGRILGLLLGEHELGLTLLQESLTKLQTSNNSLHQSKVDQLLEKVKVHMSQGQIDSAEALLEEIQNVRNQKFALLVQPSDLIDLQLAIAQIEEDSKDWASCQKTLRTLVASLTSNNNDTVVTLTPDQQLRVYTLASKCYFHQRQYDKAIEFGNLAIEMNRHYPQVYKYVVFSYFEKGDLDQAQTIANRAILYETPWDKSNQQQNETMYLELFAIQ